MKSARYEVVGQLALASFTPGKVKLGSYNKFLGGQILEYIDLKFSCPRKVVVVIWSTIV